MNAWFRALAGHPSATLSFNDLEYLERGHYTAVIHATKHGKVLLVVQ